MADKTYESYEMLAKLLNSERKENIDRAYDALSAALEQAYAEKKDESTKAYADKRDALARNRAKAEKYLDYFMTEKGYSGSGIEADAKLKSNLSYNSDLSALNASEAGALSALDAQLQTDKLKNESEKNEKKAAADKDYGDSLYKIKSDSDANALKEKQLQIQKELDEKELELKQTKQAAETALKEKEYELKKLQTEASAEKASSNSKAETEALNEKISAYRQLLYGNIKDDFENAKDLAEMQRIYDSVTGVNAEASAELFGEKLYNDMIKSFRKAITEAKVKQADEQTVQKLYDRFVNAGSEYHNQTYMKLKRELAYGNFPGFSSDQLERAYKMYLKNN